MWGAEASTRISVVASIGSAHRDQAVYATSQNKIGIDPRSLSQSADLISPSLALAFHTSHNSFNFFFSKTVSTGNPSRNFFPPPFSFLRSLLQHLNLPCFLSTFHALLPLPCFLLTLPCFSSSSLTSSHALLTRSTIQMVRSPLQLISHTSHADLATHMLTFSDASDNHTYKSGKSFSVFFLA